MWRISSMESRGTVPRSTSTVIVSLSIYINLRQISWFLMNMGVSENSVPLNPVVNDHLRRGDESQPLARIFLFPQRNVVVAAMIEVITPNVLLQSRMNRSPHHLQHLWKTSPCFATLRPPFLSITSHPLANYLVPNPNGRCSPLSFGVPPRSSVFPLLVTIFPSYSFVFFKPFSCRSSTFLRFPPP